MKVEQIGVVNMFQDEGMITFIDGPFLYFANSIENTDINAPDIAPHFNNYIFMRYLQLKDNYEGFGQYQQWLDARDPKNTIVDLKFIP